MNNLPTRFTGVGIDYYSFTSDHLHLIFVLENSDISLGEIVRTYKALVTKNCGIKPFWEWNYYEHVIRNEKALYEIRKYIQENPEKEKINIELMYGSINRTATKLSDKSDCYEITR